MDPLVPGAKSASSLALLGLSLPDMIVVILMIVVFIAALLIPPVSRRHRP